MRTIEKGKLYKHFKGKLYQIVDIVNDSETNNDLETRKLVIYKALYGEGLVWARDYDMFLSEVDHEKYPDVKQKYRFEEYMREYGEDQINAFITLDDVKDWFESQKIYSNVTKNEYEDFNTKYIFGKIKASDIMFINYIEGDVKTTICIDHAFCNNVPVYLIVRKGITLPNVIVSLSEKVIYYESIDDLICQLDELLKNGDLKTNPNTIKLQMKK